MDSSLESAVLEDLKKKGKSPSEKAGASPRFTEAARKAFDAAKSDDAEGFAKALDASIRISLAERE